MQLLQGPESKRGDHLSAGIDATLPHPQIEFLQREPLFPFEVHDLGVGVKSSVFVNRARETGAEPK